jgi:hypothetical protein
MRRSGALLHSPSHVERRTGRDPAGAAPRGPRHGRERENVPVVWRGRNRRNTLTTRPGTVAVAVTPNTKYFIRPPTAPSFANVCVNGTEVVVGSTINGVLNTNLVITIARPT